jgi:hypothetical protein
MKLLNFCVRSHTRLHNFLPFKNIKAAFKTSLFPFFVLCLLDTNCAHSSEKDLENRFHVVYKHLLEVLLLLLHVRVLLILPHLIYDALIDVPVSNMREKMLLN